jgi:outer membrane protein OmpA-like peptidoglycan-associated protein
MSAHRIPHRLAARLSCCLLLVSALALSGCAALVAAGAGAGAYTYIAGNLSRTYQAEYRPTVRASTKALRSPNFTVLSLTGDGLQTVIKGQRADQSPITVVVDRVDQQRTKVGVRMGYIGIGDREAAERVHQALASHLPHSAGRSASDSRTSATGKTKEEKPLSDKPKPVATPGKEVAMPFTRNPHYIYYRTTETTIPQSAHTMLDKVARYMAAKPAVTLELRGYTDSGGDGEENLKISRQRVQTIKQHLIKRGIQADRIKAKGYGATNFLESNNSETLRVLNRRVEMELR